MTVYAELVGATGSAPSHALLLDAVPGGARVLDVGCAEGYLARALAERGCTVVGVEFDPRAAEARAARCASTSSPATSRTPRCAPRSTARSTASCSATCSSTCATPARCCAGRDLLGPDGRAVVSLPNIGHWTARRELLRGRFPQADHGLFDRTHLRFFTRATARELVRDAGLEVEREAFAPAALPLESRVPALGRLAPRLVAWRPELFALQTVLVCRRPRG